jgi:IS30 family transposase
MAKGHGSRLTLGERQIIDDMLRGCYTVTEISKAIDRTLSTISREINLNGGKSAYNASKAHERAIEMHKMGCARSNRYNLEDRKIIEQMLKNGCTHNAIAVFLGRAQPALSREIKKNGGNEAYNAEEAQKRMESLLVQTPKEKKTLPQVNRRIDILEMQIEILMDKIKELSR